MHSCTPVLLSIRPKHGFIDTHVCVISGILRHSREPDFTLQLIALAADIREIQLRYHVRFNFNAFITGVSHCSGRALSWQMVACRGEKSLFEVPILLNVELQLLLQLSCIRVERKPLWRLLGSWSHYMWMINY